MPLTAKNREAIDWYLSADPECHGNGTKSWQRVYHTKTAQIAASNWHRMLRNADAQAYLHTRLAEIEEGRRVEIAFDRDRYMATLDELLHVTTAKYVGEDGRVHIEDAARARQIAKDLYAVETNNVFPNQQDNGPRVSINISTVWQGDGNEPMDVTQDIEVDPPPGPSTLDGEPPRVVIIGRKER
ncbi:MAG: hypothetical protein U5R46_17540 [Gammaproteobacteria bacterium]|nr:hypothetical protein [Gammaproteobacteria bacterium]